MAGLCSGRRCSSPGVGKEVSKVGPLTPRPPSSETSIHGYHPVADARAKWNAATILVVLTAVVALLGMIVVVIILRRRRIRDQRMRDSTAAAENGNVAKAGQGEEGVNKEGKWSAEAVELVVMAGETQPTFLAHPVPTPTNHPIQCPPLILPEDHPC
ncbi:hypothetical protein KC19_12G131500 [Ceratodon purpureus]|uniref:Uncharacterized protein n=1 Tax=Ceratodon purpureus TaxID=3225 RepID=A0A8T0G7X0_CERPU|nr:hypothetical protein KC19_12G131500 [Ceratodon purpureus]